MIRRNICLILTVILIILYIFVQRYVKQPTQVHNGPEITFDTSHIVLNVRDKEEKLLEGVHAYDKEDGDISDRVIVESISAFDSNLRRRVNYYVFDNDDNVSKATRTLEYSDYTPPVFSIVGNLKGDSYSFDTITSKVRARSSVEGDISSKVVVKNVDLADQRNIKVKLAATDSTNTTSYLDVIYHLEPDLPIEILLDRYLVYAKKDEDIDYKSFIKLIIERNEDVSELINQVEIEVPEMNEPGTYEVVYRLERLNGNTGKAILSVIVE